MSIAQFSLVNKIPLVITRQEPMKYVGGRPVPGESTQVEILANVQPFSDYQVYILPESDRSRNWVWVFSASELRPKKEGESGHGADRFTWNGELYEVMKSQRFQMRVRDHYEIKAARVSLTPN